MSATAHTSESDLGGAFFMVEVPPAEPQAAEPAVHDIFGEPLPASAAAQTAVRPVVASGHGDPLRGLDRTPQSPLTTGRFGRMFRAVPAADHGDDVTAQAALVRLGRAMEATRTDPADGPDEAESAIPAAYTYFAQLVDHDLTYDPASSLQRQHDPDALVHYRPPRLDLDGLYGRGPAEQPYLYADATRFELGMPLTGAANGIAIAAADLPRAASGRAIVGDPRNDGNAILSQLQGLMMRLHNRISDLNPEMSFAEVQRELRFHYQWVLVNDFLPALVSAEVLDDVLPHLALGTDPATDRPRLGWYAPRDHAYLPLEFVAAAFRFGHTMVRPGYRLNDTSCTVPVFPRAEGEPALTGGAGFPSTWAIDWARLIDIEPRPYGNAHVAGEAGGTGNMIRTQRAQLISPALVDPLAQLPERGDGPTSLVQRTLLHGRRLRLPSGQDVARAMGVRPLSDDELLVGRLSGPPGDVRGSVTEVGGAEFAGCCPLLTYVLAETVETVVPVSTSDGERMLSARRLGPVGGRIVAETIAGILVHDSSSWLNLNPRWTPTLPMTGGRFGLRDLIAEALS